VTDGKAGFPLEYLAHARLDAAELKIEAGQLLVRSANRMLGYDGQDARIDDDWRATGDLVEVVGDRVYFAGRIGDMINVGGHKVRPVAVERLLRTIDGVEDVRVYGQSSSVAGQLVACDVVPRRGYDAERLTQQIQQAARGCLASHEVPRIVRIVDVIQTSAAGKVIRRQG
jgi:acyl-coenzyme A synthetase/AMP-(fatty) acid ligase